jgi:hypothetical protein
MTDVVNIDSREKLQDFVANEGKVKYLFFWGHRQEGKEVTKACLSQWYESPFKVDGIIYCTAEQYMMAEKARLFDDRHCLAKIFKSSNPGEVKKLGRTIKSFNEEIWIKERMKIVVAGNVAKFSQNEQLREFLVNTKNRVLVEASPVDRIWGIGLAVDNPQIENPWHWKGLNLLGFALMQVREQLK